MGGAWIGHVIAYAVALAHGFHRVQWGWRLSEARPIGWDYRLSTKVCLAAMDSQIRLLLVELGAHLREINVAVGDPSLETMATYLYLKQYTAAHEAIAAVVPAGSRLLDWGAGIGHFAYVQSRLGRDVTAYSLAPNEYNRHNSVLAELAHRGGFSVVTGSDPVRLPFSAETFDCVVSCGVLEHVRESGGDDLASMREVHRVLKVGGSFVCLHLPNRYSWIEAFNRLLSRSHHSVTYAYAGLVRLAHRAGFSIGDHCLYGLLPKIQAAVILRGYADYPALVNGYYLLDSALSRIFPCIAQNRFLILRKLPPGRSRPHEGEN